MLRHLNKILAVILLIILVVLIWKSYKAQEPYSPVPLSGNNFVVNQTEYVWADTTVSVALDIAGVEGVTVVIKDLTPEMRNRFRDDNVGVELNAAIVGSGNQYLLYVYRLNRLDASKVVAHEIIHLLQYRSGRLKILPPKNIVWEGDTISADRLYSIQYSERGWEREAFDGEDGLANKMDEILYGKNM